MPKNLNQAKIDKLCHKMAHCNMEFEGYWKGTPSYRNNNPGNLKKPGTLKDASGHSIFSSFSAGWDALINQLQMMFDGRSKVYNSDMTILEVYKKYAEENYESYAAFVAIRLNNEWRIGRAITVNTMLKDLV